VRSDDFCPRGACYDEDGEGDAIWAVHEGKFWWCHPVFWVFVLLFRRILGYPARRLVPGVIAGREREGYGSQTGKVDRQ